MSLITPSLTSMAKQYAWLLLPFVALAGLPLFTPAPDKVLPGVQTSQSLQPPTQVQLEIPSAVDVLSEAAEQQPISWSELGTHASKQATGDALRVQAQDDGSAYLETRFQRLQAWVEAGQGLSIHSSRDEDADKVITPLRVLAHAVGRAGSAVVAIPRHGVVSVEGAQVRWQRPGLVEEYSVSVDGLRQDFLLAAAPQGMGELRLELEVEGAHAFEASYGARLQLEAGRTLAYSRLHVEDAQGRVLPARMEVASANRIVLAVNDVDAYYPLRIDPTFSDDKWISMGGLSGASGIVRTTVTDGAGNLYIGGDFTIVGVALANRIARWDGSTWSALGAGMNGSVSALVLDGTGNLYAGGNFTTAGGSTVNRIARWDGSAWSALGTGMNGSVSVLALDSAGNLYAGGGFTTADGNNANRIALWDGSSWSALGTGMNNWVRALVMDTAGNLYAGGSFTTAGDTSANFIARWDGSVWSALGAGMNGTVNALVLDGTGNLYAGGGFTSAGGNAVNYIARWDGSIWSALGTGMNNWVSALALDGTGNLYAGGSFTTAGGNTVNHIARWNGSVWSALGTGMNSTVNALALDGTGNLYAGGSFYTAADNTATFIARWNSSAWSALSVGMNHVVHALALDDAGNLYAGGDFISAADGNVANRIVHWNGSAWSALGSGIDGTVRSLALDGAGNLYAGGGFTTAGGNAANSIARWDGSAWSALGTGMNMWVMALALDGAGNLYAGGGFTSAGGNAVNYIARWDGSIWSALGTGMNSTVTALALDGTGNLYAGGGFTSAGGNAVNYIARWDGSIWSALGTGMNNWVSALALDGTGNLYSGGSFTTAGGNTVNHIAHWDGSAWSALGTGMNSTVTALALDGAGNLYAGGGFTSAGGNAANYIARWNGSVWSALGIGMGSSVYALALDGAGNLYAGGQFKTAGGKVSAYMAMADLRVQVSYDGNGHSSGSPPVDAASYAPGATFTVLDAASLTRTGYSFSGWNTQADGSGSSYAASSTFGIGGDDVVLYAQWSINSYTVSATAGTGGEISPASQSVNHDATAAFTLSPQTGYSIATVSGCEGSLDGSTYTTGAITAACTVEASFVLNSYTVSATAGAGGEISPASQSVNHGATANLSVTPAEGYTTVMGGSCGGTLVGSSYTTAAVVDDCQVVAQFEPIFTLDDESGQPIGDMSLLAGEAVTFQLGNGSGQYDIIIAANTHGIEGGLQDHGDGSYSFVAPATGAFAGDYGVTITDQVSGWTEQFWISVPLKLELSRSILLSRGERNSAMVTVRGAEAGTVISLSVEGELVDWLPLVDDASMVASDDTNNANPAIGEVLALEYTQPVEFELIATGATYPAGRSAMTTVVPAIAYTGSLHSPIGTAVEAAIVELRVHTGETVSTLLDELDVAYDTISDVEGDFVLYVPAGEDERSLRVRADGYATTSVAVDDCQELDPCLLLIDYETTAGIPELSPAGGGFVSDVAVMLSSPTVGATLMYTLDGSTPTRSHGEAVADGEVLLLTENTTLKVMAWKDGINDSDVLTAEYIITVPVNSSGGGSFGLLSLMLFFAMWLLLRNGYRREAVQLW